MPMLAGPGAISTVMVLVGESHAVWQHGVIYATILLTAFVSYLILAGADRVRGYLGETGIRILMRLMGLLLVALAVQFVANGLTDFGLLKPLTHAVLIGRSKTSRVSNLLRSRERVARIQVAGGQALLEPLHALRRSAVREFFRHHFALRHFLDVIVAHRRRGV